MCQIFSLQKRAQVELPLPCSARASRRGRGPAACFPLSLNLSFVSSAAVLIFLAFPLRSPLAQLGRYPKLKDIFRTVVLAVNMDYVDKGARVKLAPGDEVALIPPIGGG